MIREVCNAALLMAVTVLGIFLLFKPLAALQLAMRWPTLLFRTWLPKEWLSPSLRDALRLIQEDPSQYTRRFGYQVLIFRLSGAIALVIALVGALLTVAERVPY